MTHPSPTSKEELDAIRKRHERDRNVIHSVFHKDSMATENFNDRGALLTHIAALEAELATEKQQREMAEKIASDKGKECLRLSIAKAEEAKVPSADMEKIKESIRQDIAGD